MAWRANNNPASCHANCHWRVGAPVSVWLSIDTYVFLKLISGLCYVLHLQPCHDVLCRSHLIKQCWKYLSQDLIGVTLAVCIVTGSREYSVQQVNSSLCSSGGAASGFCGLSPAASLNLSLNYCWSLLQFQNESCNQYDHRPSPFQRGRLKPWK